MLKQSQKRTILNSLRADATRLENDIYEIKVWASFMWSKCDRYNPATDYWYAQYKTLRNRKNTLTKRLKNIQQTIKAVKAL